MAGQTARSDQGRRSRRDRRGEVEEALPAGGGARLVPRRYRLHRRDPQKRGEADVSKGVQLKDPKGLFNTRLDSKMFRAIYFHEGDATTVSALKALIAQGPRLNRS